VSQIASTEVGTRLWAPKNVRYSAGSTAKSAGLRFGYRQPPRLPSRTLRHRKTFCSPGSA